MQNNKSIQKSPCFYQLGSPYFPAYLSIGETAMFIETGIGATADLVCDQTRDLGVKVDQVGFLALTHSHFDHLGGLPRLKKKWPHVKTVASRLGAKILSSDKIIDPFKEIDNEILNILKSKDEIDTVPEPCEEFDFSIDMPVDEESRIDLGNGVCWTVIPIPGHSGCQIAFFEENEGILVIGDAVGYYNPEMDLFWPNYFESLKDYTESIRTLAKIDARKVALGHNGIVETGSRAFFKKALQATESYHEEMVQRVKNEEEIKAVAKSKAEWVWAMSDHMPAGIVPMLCQILIKQSLKADKEGGISFEL